MKKILAIAIALCMVMALSVNLVAADDTVVWEYVSPVPTPIGWNTLFEKGTENATAFFEAIQTEGAVLQLIGTDLTEADRTDEEAWFQLCTQDAVNWSPEGDSKTEDIGETYEFTDEGYIMSVPTDNYRALLESCTVPTSDMQLCLNAGGSWTKPTVKLTFRVIIPANGVAPAETEAPADTAPADEAPADAAPADTAEAPSTGLALAVVPAVVAMAAAVISKKR